LKTVRQEEDKKLKRLTERSGKLPKLPDNCEARPKQKAAGISDSGGRIRMAFTSEGDRFKKSVANRKQPGEGATYRVRF
jgi:hypothetical protein